MSGRIKAIALDLDGTLLGSRLQITRYTWEILERCLKDDIKLVIATGRGYPAAKKLAGELGPVFLW